MRKPVFVVIPNWNGAADLPASIDSVLDQTLKDFDLIIVDNGSTDNSREIIEAYKRKDPRVRSIYRDANYGYTGGVNPGIELAIEENVEFVAPFNNDAVADRDWLRHLISFLRKHAAYGIAACAILHSDGKHIDSTADQYTTWGIPFPRGRDEPANGQYDHDTDIFGASGGASCYRTDMLRHIGMFDQDFFAYYEDIDLSFRAQLAGWKISFVPEAIVYHGIGQTSARMGKRPTAAGKANTFTTKQFMKNLPFILVKDMPLGLLPKVLPRFWLAYTMFFLRACTDHRGGAALQGLALFWYQLPHKLGERRLIQKNRKVSNQYLWGLFIHDLPPNAYKLRALRARWWRLRGKKA